MFVDVALCADVRTGADTESEFESLRKSHKRAIESMPAVSTTLPDLLNRTLVTGISLCAEAI